MRTRSAQAAVGGPSCAIKKVPSAQAAPGDPLCAIKKVVP
jgi:hypothetical protein